MRNVLKKISVGFAVISLSLMGIVGFYSISLPDNYNIETGKNLLLGPMLTVMEDGNYDNYLQTSGGDISVDGLNENTVEDICEKQSRLMLFGSIPVKDIKMLESSRPMLIPGGQAFGAKLVTDGVMVVGLEEINDYCPASDCGIMVGDVIRQINGTDVMTNRKLGEMISESNGKPCSVVYIRSGEERKVTLKPVYSEGTYKSGMWVRDSSAGIGTLTFYDPKNSSFGGLGHAICDSDTGEPVPISNGTVSEVKITGCNKSEEGEPGQLSGEFISTEPVGTITQNNNCGLFGKLDKFPIEGEEMPLGFKHEVHKGKAEILSAVADGEIKKYEIVIESMNLSDDAVHNMVISVTDENLLKKTGGIVQGMSGSPIIQDGRIVGAVTHVFVDDPTKGYAIFSDKMYFKSTSVT